MAKSNMVNSITCVLCLVTLVLVIVVLVRQGQLRERFQLLNTEGARGEAKFVYAGHNSLLPTEDQELYEGERMNQKLAEIGKVMAATQLQNHPSAVGRPAMELVNNNRAHHEAVQMNHPR